MSVTRLPWIYSTLCGPSRIESTATIECDARKPLWEYNFQSELILELGQETREMSKRKRDLLEVVDI